MQHAPYQVLRVRGQKDENIYSSEAEIALQYTVVSPLWLRWCNKG